MRTVVVQGGWRVWVLVIVGGALLVVLALTVGLIALGVLAIAGVLLLGQRVMQAIGLGGRRSPADSTPESGDGVIDGEFHVITRPVEQLPEPRE